MKVSVDPIKCQSYGLCADIAPELFELDEWGYATAKGDGAVAERFEEEARTAAAECPVKAIRIEA